MYCKIIKQHTVFEKEGGMSDLIFISRANVFERLARTVFRQRSLFKPACVRVSINLIYLSAHNAAATKRYIQTESFFSPVHLSLESFAPTREESSLCSTKRTDTRAENCDWLTAGNLYGFVVIAFIIRYRIIWATVSGYAGIKDVISIFFIVVANIFVNHLKSLPDHNRGYL